MFRNDINKVFNYTSQMNAPIDKINMHEAWQGQADCEKCSLRQSVLFADLDESDFSQIHDPINQFHYNAGTRIYSSGEAGSKIYTIRSGLVKLVQYLPDGNYRIVRLMWPSDVIGLEVLVGQGYQHDAICLQGTEVCQIPRDSVNNLSLKNPVLHKSLMERWQKALSDADTWLTCLSTGTARQRIARLVVEMADKHSSGLCCLFSREDMGAMLGVTTETVSRIIAEFKRDGLLIKKTSNCYQLNIAELNVISGD